MSRAGGPDSRRLGFKKLDSSCKLTESAGGAESRAEFMHLKARPARLPAVLINVQNYLSGSRTYAQTSAVGPELVVLLISATVCHLDLPTKVVVLLRPTADRKQV